MQDLIKKIRSHMNMNQTEFAELLNVTFATVNRWENGRALPNKLAQDKIYDLCKEYDVPVYDMVLEKIEAASGSIELEKGRVLLYHGSKSGIEGDIAPLSRKQCDFGEGFYMVDVKCWRLSESYDIIPVMVSERLLDVRFLAHL